ncbi:MAG: DMT family transporter [Alphaproteobacteria bacterium]|nr:DMT family transporter [Alphaproteobacteria bacterium]
MSANAAARDRLVGLVCAVLTLLTWSGFILLTRLGVRSTMTPPDLIALRFAIAGTVMLPWLLRHGLGGLSWPRAAVLALLAGPGFAVPAFYGFINAPASHGAGLMPGTLPIWTVLLAALVAGERLTRLKSAGVMLTIGGIMMITGPHVVDAKAGVLLTDLLFPAASLNWALYTVLARRWSVAPLQSAAIVFVLSGVVCVPIYLAVWGPRLLAAPLDDLIVQGVYQGLVATIVSLLFYMRAVRALGAGPTTLITAAVPGMVTLAGIPLLGEVPSPSAIAGILLVTAGVVVTVVSTNPQRGSQAAAAGRRPRRAAARTDT